ncbi:Do family serine endopeptidase [Algibacillus agarilyticus]|uniref:Do family serine endopeptidase n=1 Tax=Algibacillus agarilyticus TaxID=2234133 RepID=UPI000DCFFDC1|nr:Do family serine endopeptidase [Algibacillus agarilyticus]
MSVFNLPKIIILTACLAIPTFANAGIPWFNDNDKQPTLAPMLEKTTPAVVNISAAGTKVEKQEIPEVFRRFFGHQSPRNQQTERPFSSVGSGVIIDAKKGYVVTNHHVIDNADEIVVTLKDGRQFDAKKLGSDPKSDVALLQISADNLTAIGIANSDELRVGDFAIAIGNPFGLGQTVTSGIVSALGRSGLGVEKLENFIQTDAAINSGNSGGALVNFKGDLIGINTAILGPNGGNVGIGFAIPSNMMQSLVDQIIEYGEVKRGVLGISGRSITAESAKSWGLDTPQGAFVEQVYPDTAAAEAGLKAGDIIVSVNGKTTVSFNELRAQIATIGAGKTVTLGIIRESKEQSIDVVLREASASKVEAAVLHPALEGAELSNAEDGGISVDEVASRSPAHAIGLKTGDIIVGVNRLRIKNIAELREIFDEKKGSVYLNIVRGQTSLYIFIR